MENLSIENQPFLFASVISPAACQRCFDSGIWLTPRNEIATCPRILMREPHAEMNDAALIMRRAAILLKSREIWIHEQSFDTARILTNYDSQTPCDRNTLIDLFFADTNLTDANRLRKFHSIIEDLRTNWLLPIAARKAEPSGYWIIADVEDCKQWLRHATAAPKTQLATIWRVARHNFPVLAGQTEFDFMNALEEAADAV